MSNIVNKPDNDVQAWRGPDFTRSAGKNRSLHNIDGASMRTQDQLDKIYREAHEQGFAQGRDEGMKKGQQELGDQVIYLHSIMASLSMPLLDLDKQVVDELVELSMCIVRHMVRRELKISPGEIVAVVREALNELPLASSDVSLELHPEDAILIRGALAGADNELPWKIVEVPTLRRGGCRVISNTSRIDATVENRINAAIASVMGGERRID